MSASGANTASRELRDREPEPVAVAAAVAFISTADATGVGDK